MHHTDTDRRTVLKGLSLALGSAALSGCASAPLASTPLRQGDSAAALAQLQDWLGQHMRKRRHANLSVAVLDGDSVTWSAGFGMADPDRQVAASAQTRYRAGSISKVFTAMAAMRLAEQGRLALDAPLSDALPEFRLQSRFEQAGPVTARLILQHRSGLPSDRIEGMWTDSPEPYARLVERLHSEHMAAPPGQGHAYCNLGFTLLGAAIERVTGEPFDRWMQHEWLDPMGMASSTFQTAAPTGLQAAAARDAKGKVQHEHGLRDLPAGGLNSTVLDLLQLARLWFAQGEIQGRRLLAPSSLAAMQTLSAPPALGDFAPMGLGWFLPDEVFDGVGPLLWHAGGTPHHHAQLMLLPEMKLAVAVMSSTVTEGEWAHEVAQKALALLATARTGTDPVRRVRTGVDPVHPPRPMAAFAGHYDTPVGVVQIEANRRGTQALALGKRLNLVTDADGYARAQYRLLGLLPIHLGRLGEVAFTGHTTADAQTWLLVRHKGRFGLLGTRLEPAPLPSAWLQRLGVYRYAGGDPYLAEQFKAVRLKASAGLLLAEVDAGSDSSLVALAPLNDEQATVRGLGRNRGDTVLALEEAGQDVLLYSGMRFVRQRGD